MPYVTSISNSDNEPVFKILYDFSPTDSEEILDSYFQNSESYNMIKEKYPKEDYDIVTAAKMTITVYKKEPELIQGMS